MSRTRIAQVTGLSNASITAIGGELIGQNVILDAGEVEANGRQRGRPAVAVKFNRHACHAIIVELDVNRARSSLIDYAGTLVDRIERAVVPELFAEQRPSTFIIGEIERLRTRNPEVDTTLRSISISVQGILDRASDRLKWSPIPHVSGESIVAELQRAFGCDVHLNKRGRLLAEGTRLLYPEFRDQTLATVFIGSTVAMGMSVAGRAAAEGGATEFGHMNHHPDGARCRCGMRGCIEAYAADYGVLRTAYGVPEQAMPAASVPPAAYQELIHLGQSGRRNVIHAFNVAGRAIGYGLARLMALLPPDHIVIVGPGAGAYGLMREEIRAALAATLVCKINGGPSITVHHDEREPIFQGLVMSTLTNLDRHFALLTPSPPATSVELRK